METFSHFLSAELEVLSQEKLVGLFRTLDRIFKTGKNSKGPSLHLTIAILSVTEDGVGLVSSTLQDWKNTFIPSLDPLDMDISGSGLTFLDYGSLGLWYSNLKILGMSSLLSELGCWRT